jgi:hypothetical protein
VVQKGKSDLNADRIAEKSPVHKCQNLAVLDRTFDSIYQGPMVVGKEHVCVFAQISTKYINLEYIKNYDRVPSTLQTAVNSSF